MGNPASFVELEEDKVILDAIQIEPVANIPGRFKLSLEYPVQPGVDLAYILYLQCCQVQALYGEN